MELRPRHWLGLGAATSVAAFGVSLLYRFDPNASNSPFPPCVFRAVTGCYCPGCGMTRALYALVHFDLPGAFAMNPAAVLGLFTLPGLIAWKAGWRRAGSHPSWQ
ncbi:hypothetical protein XHC_0522 [Xanthomonas hortorum pv. carotae str. M081]|nr:hypothetical protein XHC_0522 [Xanthomonas hortorum pv. carotae str. M081]